MENETQLLFKRERIIKRMQSLQKAFDTLQLKLEQVEEELKELQNKPKSYNNIIKDLVYIYSNQFENDKSKRKVSFDLIANKLIDSELFVSKPKVTVYNINESYEILFYDKEMGQAFRGIAFYVIQHDDKTYIFLMLIASEGVNNSLRDAAKQRDELDPIKFLSDEFDLINSQYLKNNILIMSRYLSKYNYDDERIIGEFNAMLQLAYSLNKKLLEQNIVTEIDYFSRVMPLSKSLVCEHYRESMKIKIPFLRPDGEVFFGGPYRAEYCDICDMYFIDDEVFNRITNSSEGKALIFASESKQSELNEQSILYICGYNVSEKDNLSEVQRQSLLGKIVDKDLLSKKRIMSYLTYFISLNKHNRNKGKAISKWTKDLLYIKTY